MRGWLAFILLLSAGAVRAELCRTLLAPGSTDAPREQLRDTYREVLKVSGFSLEQLVALRESGNPLMPLKTAGSEQQVIVDAFHALAAFADRERIDPSLLRSDLLRIVDEWIAVRQRAADATQSVEKIDRAQFPLPRQPELEFEFPDFERFQFSPDSQAVFSLNNKRNRVSRLDLQTGEVIAARYGTYALDPRNSLGFSVDGKSLYVGGGGLSHVLSYDATTLEYQSEIWNIEPNLFVLSKSRELIAYRDAQSTTRVRKIKDGQVVAKGERLRVKGGVGSFTLNDTYLAIQDAKTDIHRFHPLNWWNWSYSFDAVGAHGYAKPQAEPLHPTEPHIAIADLEGTTVDIWNWQKNQLVRKLRIPEFEFKGFTGAAYSSSGKYLAAATDQPAAIVLWESASGEVVASWRVSGMAPWKMGFSPDGRRLLTFDDDDRLRIWNVEKWVGGK